MTAFLRSLLQAFFNKFDATKNNFFALSKSLFLSALIPFVYVTLFIPMVLAQEAFIYGVSFFFGSGLLSTFVNYFWSVHINFCIAAIYAFKLTVYYNSLYTTLRTFQFLSIGKLK